MSTGSEPREVDRQKPPGQSVGTLHTWPGRSPLRQTDVRAHVSPGVTQSAFVEHRSDVPVPFAFWQLWSVLSAGRRVPSGRMAKVAPLMSAKKSGSAAKTGPALLPPKPCAQRCAAGRLVAQATSTRWAAWWPAVVGANVTVTDDVSPAPRSTAAGATVKPLESAAGGGSAGPTSSRPFSWLVGSVETLRTVSVRVALVPGATEPNSSGPLASILSVPGVRPASRAGQAKSVFSLLTACCPSLTVSRTVRSAAVSANTCVGFRSSEVDPSPKSQWKVRRSRSGSALPRALNWTGIPGKTMSGPLSCATGG